MVRGVMLQTFFIAIFGVIFMVLFAVEYPLIAAGSVLMLLLMRWIDRHASPAP